MDKFGCVLTLLQNKASQKPYAGTVKDRLTLWLRVSNISHLFLIAFSICRPTGKLTKFRKEKISIFIAELLIFYRICRSNGFS